MNDIQWAQWAAAVATFLAVLVALRLHLKFLPPKLNLALRSPDGEATEVLITKEEEGVVRATSKRQARYYHLLLTNDRPWISASDAGVYLVSIDTVDAAGRYVEVWSGAVPVIATHYGVHPSRTLGASPQDYDLCSVVRDKWMQLHTIIVPNNMPHRFRAEAGPTKLRVTFQARSLEAVSRRFSFELAWDGQWSDDAATMRQHMVVRPL